MPGEKYPLDFDALQKGEWLETAELEEALGVTMADGAKWNFALMGLRSQIERESGIVCRIDHDRIRLMTDTEADEYLYRQGERSVSKLVRVTRSRALIDRGSMTDQEKRVAASRDTVMMATATAARMTLRRQRRANGLTPGSVLPELDESIED